jgi:hypothetical protein
MDVYELLTKSLEDAELDIYNGTDVENVDSARRKALADIHGAQVAEMFSETEAENWKKRIEKVTAFRRASLEWRE